MDKLRAALAEKVVKEERTAARDKQVSLSFVETAFSLVVLVHVSLSVCLCSVKAALPLPVMC